MTSDQADTASLELAELQFRMAVHLADLCNAGPGLPGSKVMCWSFGKHSMEVEEVNVPPGEQQRASVALQHSATYLLAVAMNTVLERALHGDKRFRHPNRSARHACQIARLVRNAFAHSPFQPTWDIRPQICRDQQYEVESLIALDTTGKHGVPVDRLHYGGPIALLRLSGHIRTSLATWLEEGRRSTPTIEASRCPNSGVLDHPPANPEARPRPVRRRRRT